MCRCTWLVFIAALELTSGVAYAQHPLAAPWQHADIGDVGIPGSATVSNDGDLFMTAAGSDIWGTSDSFHFVYQMIYDGEISTNSASLQNTNPHAKIGVMVRQTLAPDSPHVILDLQPDGSIEFMQRAVAGGETTFIAGLPASSHYWSFDLLRSNGTITARVCGGIDGCRTVGTTTFPDGPAYVGAVLTSHDPNVLNHGGFAAATPKVVTIPQPWFSADVGNTGLPGAAYFQSGMINIQGAGADIWGTSDAYHIVGQPFSGDGQIIARVTAEDAANTFAKAGLVLTDSDGATVIIDIRPNGVVEFMSRPSAGAPMSFVAGTAMSFPVWLRLTRLGNQFEGFISANGINWSLVGFTEVSMRSDITAGLAVTSHDISGLNSSTFDSVQVNSGNLTNADIGDVGARGGIRPNGDGTMTQWGSGADIWGTEDAFNFDFRALVNDGSMLLYVKSLDDTNAFAKVGIMIRHLIDPTAKHVMVDVTPSGHVEFLMRDTWGGETTYVGGGSFQFPLFLRLERSGASITGSASQNGSPWVTIGTVSLDLPPDVYIGTAVTSHSRGVVAAAVGATFTQ
jgi:hypothetical protein